MTVDDTGKRLATARDRLAQSDRVVVFSGAGLSAESGLSTFRDPDADSLWSRFDPTQLASPEGFAADPKRVIDWYNWRRETLAAVTPNPAHRALARQPRLVQVTQNVDDLLERAGVAPQQVCHLHGSLLLDRCHADDCDYCEGVDPANPPGLRACPRCAAHLRPAVVWFGEPLPRHSWERALDLCAATDCLLVVGTSATVYPAASLVEVARRNGSHIIVIDPAIDAAGARGDLHLARPAGEILPALLDGLELTSGG